MPVLYSIEEVAVLLGLHKQTVAHLIRSGELGSVKIGRRVLCRDDQMIAFIDAHTHDAEL